MSLTKAQIHYYMHTDYVVKQPPLIIHIGSRHPALDALLKQNQAVEWCFITAANPYSRVLSDADNDSRNQQLIAACHGAGWSTYAGYGKSQISDWLPEPSLLVLGISATDAKQLAVRYQQNAIVIGALDKPSELLLCVDNETG